MQDEKYTHTDNNYTNEDKEKLSNLFNYDDTDILQDINLINEKIPTQANIDNKLADKNYVNSSLNSITAFYITKDAEGNQFKTKKELDDAIVFYSGGEIRVPTRNDYCIVLEDETKDNATTRYIYQRNQWEFQYIVNETALTSDQVAALNSGITVELVAKLQGIDLTNYIKNTDYATSSKAGVVKTNSQYGTTMSNDQIVIEPAPYSNVKLGSQARQPITTSIQHQATFFGLAKASGDTTQSTSSNPVGAYTNEAKTAIKRMLGVSEQVALTQSEYDALVEAGTVDENTYYYIKEE